MLAPVRFALRSAVRGYAAASSAPPLALTGPHGSYASALYSAAVKSSCLDPVASSLASLASLVHNDNKLHPILANPALSSKDRATVVEVLAKSAGAHSSIKNLLTVMAENNRLGLIKDVAAAFAALMRAHRGEMEATVTSAQPLDAKTLLRLETALTKSSLVGQGKKLKLENKVNENILGGLVVEIGDRTIDLSIASHINKLNKLLTDTI
ncbi:ATP synthase subunit 5, mitochondrial [Neolecta irregularis DAH-3]|uniref:ATP synthase subunit 5, mitochondrial n=1 Tax=Neolecta irregularis (strain DAH-3) TaxID=1198029 RepID=A0A1U7LGQ2_NEOID|nr:ATP synthase subunit 5, mitochondrial [Neolecta irregularis DAH-3]|eukprot:OLL21827.1 ATP synthase subunit 5, mitochondrial [Neolecta irregularis DAH-3]